MAKELSDFDGAHTIDVREVIERVEESDAIHDELFDAAHDEDFTPEVRAENEKRFAEWQAEEGGECSERAILRSLLDELKGYGGDEQWEGDWYPVELIEDSEFKDYAQRLAEDTCDMEQAASWPFRCIDWEKAAEELKQDYSTVEFQNVTYYYR